jgi:hypothetical protein
MRTTLTIDDDVLSAAKHLARQEQRTVGDVISSLARQGLNRGHRSPGAQRNGIPLLATRKNASPVTPDFVNRLRDQLK